VLFVFSKGKLESPYGISTQFGKCIHREIFLQGKVWKTQEYFVYFKFFKPHPWGKRSDEGRRRNCVGLPSIRTDR